jgi:hypothetical protein
MTQFAYSPDSPIGVLYHRTSAALAEGLIEAGCPHSAFASSLRLPLHVGVLLCSECDAEMVTDPGPGECAACGAPDGNLWFIWPDVPARVAVTAQVCPRCLKTGNRSMAAN